MFLLQCNGSFTFSVRREILGLLFYLQKKGETGEFHQNRKILYHGRIILEYVSLGLMLVE